jgi:hypothetical protein
MRKLLLLLLLIQMIPIIARAQNVNEELILAVRKSDVEAVKALLAKGADANTRAEYERTALSYACDRGNIEIVKMLLAAGADLNLKDSFYKAPPINWAVIKDNGEVVKLLIQKGARGKEDVMASAVFQKKKNTVKSLLELGGFSAEAMTDYLTTAEQSGASEIVELLKNAGAKPSLKPQFKIEPEALKAYEGVFKNAAMEFSFQIKEGKLTGGTSGFEFVLLPVDKHTFESKSGMNMIAVFTLEGGQVASVIFKLPAGQIVLKKVEAKQQ